MLPVQLAEAPSCRLVIVTVAHSWNQVTGRMKAAPLMIYSPDGTGQPLHRRHSPRLPG
jgi:hypothetical protein